MAHPWEIIFITFSINLELSTTKTRTQIKKAKKGHRTYTKYQTIHSVTQKIRFTYLFWLICLCDYTFFFYQLRILLQFKKNKILLL